MANKYSKFSKVGENKRFIGRMAGALKTCARKKSFRTYETALKRGSDLRLNPYVCPWCGKYHLTSGEGDPRPLQGVTLREYNACLAQLSSHKVETLIKGLINFRHIKDLVGGKQRADMYRLMEQAALNIDALDGLPARKRILLRRIVESTDYSSSQ